MICNDLKEQLKKTSIILFIMRMTSSMYTECIKQYTCLQVGYPRRANCYYLNIMLTITLNNTNISTVHVPSLIPFSTILTKFLLILIHARPKEQLRRRNFKSIQWKLDKRPKVTLPHHQRGSQWKGMYILHITKHFQLLPETINYLLFFFPSGLQMYLQNSNCLPCDTPRFKQLSIPRSPFLLFSLLFTDTSCYSSNERKYILRQLTLK